MHLNKTFNLNINQYCHYTSCTCRTNICKLIFATTYSCQGNVSCAFDFKQVAHVVTIADCTKVYVLDTYLITQMT